MKKILVVDDSSVARLKTGAIVQELGHEMVEARDGVEALARLKEGDIALVICDVNMPRMSGLEMLENIKRDARGATIPVLVLTTEGTPELVARAKKAGAKGWFVKPFRPEQMLTAVEKLLGSARESR
jgi:two-component system chemotaxis response regulator CheY